MQLQNTPIIAWNEKYVLQDRYFHMFHFNDNGRPHFN